MGGSSYGLDFPNRKSIIINNAKPTNMLFSQEYYKTLVKALGYNGNFEERNIK